MLNDRNVQAAAAAGTSMQATVELMNANLERGRINFGPSADNMTALVLFLFPRTKTAVEG